jgi:hypothetical protein
MMNNNELITHVPEHLKATPSLDVEVTEIHTSADIVVTHIPEYVSSAEYHIPTMKALGGAAMKSEFRGDPSKVPGTDAYAQRQVEISNMARSEWAASNAHVR